MGLMSSTTTLEAASSPTRIGDQISRPSSNHHRSFRHRSCDDAEIDGGPLPTRSSLYLHLEQGLAASFNKPAIISVNQPACHFDALLITKDQYADNYQQSKHRTKPDSESPLLSNGEGHAVSLDACLELTFGSLQQISLNLSAGLLSTGIKSNATLLMLIDNVAEYGLLLWTAMIMRLTIACGDVEVLQASGSHGLRTMLKSLQPSIVVVSNQKHAVIIDALLEELKLAAPIKICIDDSQALPSWCTLASLVQVGAISSVDRDEVLEQARNDDGDRVNSILFTSGTSGQPKGCPQRAVSSAHVLQSQAWLLNGGAHTAALQQAHPSRGIATAQVMQTWRAGGTVVMTSGGLSINDALAAIEDHKVTFLVLTPPMVHAIAAEIRAHRPNVDSVLSIQIGGDAVTKSALTTAASVFPKAKVFVNHGMTEGTGCFFWPFSNTPLSKIPYFGGHAPVGAVAPGSCIRIWDVQKKMVARRGELGELHVRGGSLIHHYLFGRSESSFYDDSHGRWFIPGDIAVMDASGLVSILGRRKEMVVRAGVQIMPAPIECCIEDYTQSGVVVIGVPGKYGQTSIWAVVDNTDCESLAGVQDHVTKTLGFEYSLDGLLTLGALGLTEFPVNGTHKIMKDELRRILSEHIQQRAK